LLYETDEILTLYPEYIFLTQYMTLQLTTTLFEFI